MNLFKRTALAVALFVVACAPALAQWQTPNHSVPVGRGAGTTGFKSVAPGTAGLPLISNGATADPSFAPVASSGVAYTSPGTGAVPTTVSAAIQRTGIWANDFGAACNGGGNDLAAFQNAVNIAQTLTVPLKFMGAACVISGTLNITDSLDMSGQFENSVLYQSDLSLTSIFINTNRPVHLHDFNMNYTAVSNAGITAIVVNAPTGENGGSVFERLHIGNNAMVGINYLKSSSFHLLHSTIVGIGTAVIVANGNVADSGDSEISGNQFQAGLGGAAVVYNSSGGLRFINNKVNGNNLAYGLQMALAPGAFTADLFITGNSIEAIASNGSAVWFGRAGTTGGFGVVNITGNELSGGSCINVPTDPNGAWLLNMAISGNTCILQNVSGAVAFNIDSTLGLALGVNSVQSFNANSKKVAIGSQVTGAIVDEPGGLGTFLPSTYGTGTVARNPQGMPFASLPTTIGNGSQIYVTDGTAASSPCTGGGSGAMATRQNGAWKCF